MDERPKYSSRQIKATAMRCTHAPREDKNKVEEGIWREVDGVVGGVVMGVVLCLLLLLLLMTSAAVAVVAVMVGDVMVVAVAVFGW